MKVETGVRRVLEWRCPALEETVLVDVRGSIFDGLINGKVEGCRKADCPAKNTPYCLIGTRIQAAAKP